jgi:hypothetical protein
MMRVKVLLLAFALFATTAVAQGWTVDPGKGVGPLALNMSPTQIATQMAPTEYIGSPQNPMYVRYGEDLMVQYASNKAVMITLNKPTVKTKAGAMKWTPPNGAGIGTAWNVVEPNLGRNYISRDLKVAKGQPRETYYAYSSKGLGFRTKGGIIVQVDVWPAK